MQALGHLALHSYHALVRILLARKGRHDSAGERHFAGCRGEGGVAGLDLLGVDQRHAIEPEVAPLPTVPVEPLQIFDVVEDPVENGQSLRAGRRGGSCRLPAVQS